MQVWCYLQQPGRFISEYPTQDNWQSSPASLSKQNLQMFSHLQRPELQDLCDIRQVSGIVCLDILFFLYVCIVVGAWRVSYILPKREDTNETLKCVKIQEVVLFKLFCYLNLQNIKQKKITTTKQQQNSGQGSLIEFPNITELINVKGNIQTQVHCNLIEIFFSLGLLTLTGPSFCELLINIAPCQEPQSPQLLGSGNFFLSLVHIVISLFRIL